MLSLLRKSNSKSNGKSNSDGKNNNKNNRRSFGSLYSLRNTQRLLTKMTARKN